MLYRLLVLAVVSLVAVAANAPTNPTNASFPDASDAQTMNLMATPADHIQHRIRAGAVPVRGVNLGGWLVGEKWMTAAAPFWSGVSDATANGGEFVTLRDGPNRANRVAQLVNHHATFVMEGDVQAMALAGMNTVRVPVGYWITGNDPHDTSGMGDWKMFPTDTLQRVDTLIRDWALKYNVAVMLSIHGAKGSQNGMDHSAPTNPGNAYWSKYPENVQNTIYVAKFLGDRYKNDAAFLGIALLNEPSADTDEGVLNKYYLDAYQAVRASGNDCILTIMPLLYKQTPDNLVGFMEKPSYTNVWVEWHPYFIWGYENWSPGDLVNNAIYRDFQNKMNQWNSRPNANKMFFGEWSLASAGQYTNPSTDGFKNWARAQISVMNQGKAGWTYWSWRVYEDEQWFNGWSLRSVLRDGALKKIVLG